MAEYPLVSIIILNYNGYSKLGTLLFKNIESVLATDYPNFEVIFVDNGSTDGSVQTIAKIYGNNERMKVVKLDRNFGFAAGNNIGSKHIDARCKYIVFLNNDTIVKRNWLANLVQVMEEDPNIASAQSLILTLDGKRIDGAGDFLDLYGYPIIRSHQELYKGQFNEVKEIFSARGAAMIVRRELFEKIGGFDEDFFAGLEDVDLGWRLRLIGYKAVLVPTSICYHLGSATIKHFKILSRAPSKNYLALIIKNYDIRNMLRYLPFPFLVYFLSLFRAIVMDRDAIIPIITQLIRSIVEVKKALLKRAYVQKYRKIDDETIRSSMLKLNLFIFLFTMGLRWHIKYNSFTWEDFLVAQIKAHKELRKLYGV